jgi:hypothetical protein
VIFLWNAILLLLIVVGQQESFSRWAKIFHSLFPNQMLAVVTLTTPNSKHPLAVMVKRLLTSNFQSRGVFIGWILINGKTLLVSNSSLIDGSPPTPGELTGSIPKDIENLKNLTSL